MSDLCQVVTEHLEGRLIMSPYLCGSGSREMKEIEYKRQLNVFDCVAQRVTPKAMKQKKDGDTRRNDRFMSWERGRTRLQTRTRSVV